MKKFQDAFRGLKEAVSHKAVALQFLLAALAVLAGFVIRLDYDEWLAYVFSIGLVICSEIFNTCIEKTCDLISKEKDDRIRNIKDMAAGAVLVSSLTALTVCLFTILRRIL